MYQNKKNNNIVFINAEKDFAGLRGTYTFGKTFHGIVPGSRHDGFWWFRTSNDPTGQSCRDRNPELEYILPDNKDWNEDLHTFLYNRFIQNPQKTGVHEL